MFFFIIFHIFRNSNPKPYLKQALIIQVQDYSQAKASTICSQDIYVSEPPIWRSYFSNCKKESPWWFWDPTKMLNNWNPTNESPNHDSYSFLVHAILFRHIHCEEESGEKSLRHCFIVSEKSSKRIAINTDRNGSTIWNFMVALSVAFHCDCCCLQVIISQNSGLSISRLFSSENSWVKC